MGKGGIENVGKEGHLSGNSSEVGEMYPAWAKEVDECVEIFGTDKVSGLNSKDVSEIRGVYGFNELEKHEGTSFWTLIVDQFHDTLVRILLLAAVVSFLLAWFGDVRI